MVVENYSMSDAVSHWAVTTSPSWYKTRYLLWAAPSLAKFCQWSRSILLTSVMLRVVPSKPLVSLVVHKVVGLGVRISTFIRAVPLVAALPSTDSVRLLFGGIAATGGLYSNSKSELGTVSPWGTSWGSKLRIPASSAAWAMISMENKVCLISICGEHMRACCVKGFSFLNMTFGHDEKSSVCILQTSQHVLCGFG